VLSLLSKPRYPKTFLHGPWEVCTSPRQRQPSHSSGPPPSDHHPDHPGLPPGRTRKQSPRAQPGTPGHTQPSSCLRESSRQHSATPKLISGTRGSGPQAISGLFPRRSAGQSALKLFPQLTQGREDLLMGSSGWKASSFTDPAWPGSLYKILLDVVSHT